MRHDFPLVFCFFKKSRNFWAQKLAAAKLPQKAVWRSILGRGGFWCVDILRYLPSNMYNHSFGYLRAEVSHRCSLRFLFLARFPVPGLERKHHRYAFQHISPSSSWTSDVQTVARCAFSFPAMLTRNELPCCWSMSSFPETASIHGNHTRSGMWAGREIGIMLFFIGLLDLTQQGRRLVGHGMSR